jgi:hypothetical protein
MRTLMVGDARLPMPVYEPGEPLWGPAIGEVVAAPGTDLAQGDLVRHDRGWREYAVVDAAELTRVDHAPDVAIHLSQAFVAWLGVVRAAEVRGGDTVFVTGAAGGVGSLAGQFRQRRRRAAVRRAGGGTTGRPRRSRRDAVRSGVR